MVFCERPGPLDPGEMKSGFVIRSLGWDLGALSSGFGFATEFLCSQGQII